MSINIKNKEAERLLEAIKAWTGKGASAVVLDLLRKEHEQLTRDQEREIAEGLESLRQLQEAWRKLPVMDPRSADEMLDYDQNGLPR